MLNLLKFVVKFIGLVFAPVAFGYAGYFLFFVANNNAAWYVTVAATLGFGFMMLNRMLRQLKSMNWGVTSMIMMTFAGVCVSWAISIDPVNRFFTNTLVLIAGIFGLYCSYMSYEEPAANHDEDEIE